MKIKVKYYKPVESVFIQFDDGDKPLHWFKSRLVVNEPVTPTLEVVNGNIYEVTEL